MDIKVSLEELSSSIEQYKLDPTFHDYSYVVMDKINSSLKTIKNQPLIPFSQVHQLPIIGTIIKNVKTNNYITSLEKSIEALNKTYQFTETEEKLPDFVKPFIQQVMQLTNSFNCLPGENFFRVRKYTSTDLERLKKLGTDFYDTLRAGISKIYEEKTSSQYKKTLDNFDRSLEKYKTISGQIEDTDQNGFIEDF